jgi:uracil-DNA glycosylase
MSSYLFTFVPLYGTKVNKRAIEVQLAMTNSKKCEILELLYSYKSFGIEYIDSLNYDKNEKEKFQLPNTIEQLEIEAFHCSLCDLSKDNTQFEFGIGNKYSQIYVIGVNQYQFASELVFNSFKNMIENVLLLNFNDIYITNIIKCATKQNISKLNKSIELCENYLFKQIEIVKPKLIIALDFAFNYLMKSDENIVDISGNNYEYKGIKLIPLLHPEFVYKNPSYKDRMFNDLKKIKSLMEKI